jgi:uncharacterized membrane protein YbaN (DUF454 family)
MVEQVKHTVGKIISFALILVFVALGVIGILLPILPGLVFMLIAALIAARHFPALGWLLERNRYSRKALQVSNGFMDLGWWDKLRLCFWGTVKITLDGVQWGVRAVGRVISSLSAKVKS